MNTSSNKPMTIREYKKNFKLPSKNSTEKERENLDKSQNILLYKILKNKKINANISMDSSISKTIESIFHKEEKKKKVLFFLKKKNHKITNTSHILSPNNKREAGASPTFYMGNIKKNSNHKKSEFSSSNKSLNNENTNNKTSYKKVSNKDIFSDSCFSYKNLNQAIPNKKKDISGYKAVTPLSNIRNQKNANSSLDIGGNRDKKVYGEVYKKKDHSHLFHYNNHNNIKNDKKELSPIQNQKILKFIKKQPMNLNVNTNIKKNDYNNIKDKYKKKNLTTVNSTKEIHNEKEIYNNNINSNNNINNSNINIKSNINTDINRIKNSSNLSNNSNGLNNSNIIIKKEFDNLQIKKTIFFNIKNIIAKQNINVPVEQEKISNLIFKSLKQEKSSEVFIKNQNKKKIVPNKEKKNIQKDQYTGYILLKKSLGIIEKEIKFDNNIDNIKNIFLNILNDISEDKLELITTNELTSLKSKINENINIINDLDKEKNENTLKEQKIKEQENIIQKKEDEFLQYQQEYQKLEYNYEQLKKENDNLKQKISFIQDENKKLMEENNNLKEECLKYKSKKDEKMNNEIKILEGKIKNYKLELKKSYNNNDLKKNNFNIVNENQNKKRLSMSYNYKFDALLNSFEKKKNIVKKKNSTIYNKLIIPDEKKIMEDIEDKEEKEGIEGDYEKTENENKTLEDNKETLENKKELENKETQEKKEDKEDYKIKDFDINDIEETEEIILEKPIIVNNIDNKNNNDNNINNTDNNNKDNNNKDNINKNEEQSINANTTNKKDNLQSSNSKIIQKNSIPKPKTYMGNNTNNNIPKNNNDAKEEKQKKMSKALNRARKKMSQAQPNILPKNYQNERSNSCVKRSDKIKGIAKMLEQQMGKRDEKIDDEDNKPMTDDETERELNMIELIKKKPTTVDKKRKPTLKKYIF